MEKLIKRFKAAVPPGPAAATMIEGWMHKMANAGLPAALTGKESSESLAAAIEELRLLDPQLLEAYMVIGETTGLEDGGPIADICTDMEAQVHRRKFDEAEEQAEAERLEAERVKKEEAEEAALASMAEAEEKIKKLQKLEKELNIETEEDLLEIMEKEQEKADRANAQVEAAQAKLKAAGEAGDEELAKEAAKELRKFMTIASEAELQQAELSELKAMREKIEMEKSKTAWEQAEIKLKDLKEQIAQGADLTEELKAHEEHTLHLKTEYERELAEFEEAQAKADKEREEAEATKDAKEDAEMAASLALAEVSVAKQRPNPHPNPNPNGRYRLPRSVPRPPRPRRSSPRRWKRRWKPRNSPMRPRPRPSIWPRKPLPGKSTRSSPRMRRIKRRGSELNP